MPERTRAQSFCRSLSLSLSLNLNIESCATHQKAIKPIGTKMVSYVNMRQRPAKISTDFHQPPVNFRKRWKKRIYEMVKWMWNVHIFSGVFFVQFLSQSRIPAKKMVSVTFCVFVLSVYEICMSDIRSDRVSALSPSHFVVWNISPKFISIWLGLNEFIISLNQFAMTAGESLCKR